MERKKYSPRSILKIALGIVFGAWLMMCAPTGWIYDLWAGTGTGQGQTPDPSVSVVHTQSDVEEAYFQDTPVTATKEGLIEAPPCCACGTPTRQGNTLTESGVVGGSRQFSLTSTFPWPIPSARSGISCCTPLRPATTTAITLPLWRTAPMSASTLTITSCSASARNSPQDISGTQPPRKRPCSVRLRRTMR